MFRKTTTGSRPSSLCSNRAPSGTSAMRSAASVKWSPHQVRIIAAISRSLTTATRTPRPPRRPCGRRGSARCRRADNRVEAARAAAHLGRDLVDLVGEHDQPLEPDPELGEQSDQQRAVDVAHLARQDLVADDERRRGGHRPA